MTGWLRSKFNVHGSVHRNNMLVYKSQQDAYVKEFIFVWELFLNVSGFIITHLQEHKTTVTTASGNSYTVPLSAAIVEEYAYATHKTLKPVPTLPR
jgi:hypothetical protein